MKPPEIRKAATCVDCRNSTESARYYSVKCLKYNYDCNVDQVCASYEEPLTGEVNE